MLQTEAYLMIVIYDCKTFIVQATGVSTGYNRNLKLRFKSQQSCQLGYHPLQLEAPNKGYRCTQYNILWGALYLTWLFVLSYKLKDRLLIPLCQSCLPNFIISKSKQYKKAKKEKKYLHQSLINLKAQNIYIKPLAKPKKQFSN